MMGSLQTQVQSLLTQTPRMRPLQPRCFRCNRFGHISRDCFATILPSQQIRSGQHQRQRNTQSDRRNPRPAAPAVTNNHMDSNTHTSTLNPQAT
ncbi:hypothetical protein X975_14121, partial [Stegodyphus mimosarum]